MPIELFPDQIEFNAAATEKARQGYKAILMQGATGFGKSICATSQIQKALSRDKKCAFIVPKRDLLRQMSLAFDNFGIPHSFIADKYAFNPYSRVHICTVGSLVKRLDKIQPDLLFVDETHVGEEMLDKIISYYKSKGAWIIGLSATPIKLSGQGLDRWYDTMVNSKSIRWLIDNKRLSDYRLFAPNTPDLSGIKTVAGDYAKGQLDERMTKDRVLIGDAVKYYKEHAYGKLNVAFCTSLKHSELVCDTFNKSGITAESIDGTMSDVERKAMIRRFAKRDTQILCSVDLLHTGFDLSSNADMDVTVEAMTDLRPTQSLALQMQKFGRVLRYKPYPALIFDHAGNVSLHGLPCQEREWSLKGREKKERSGDKYIPVRQCTACFFCHKPSPTCPNCGFAYPIQSREIEHIEGELVEVNTKEGIALIPKDRKRQYNYLKNVKHLPENMVLAIIKKQMEVKNADQN